MANNVINAVFSSSTITYTKPAYQYDYGMILKFSGIELPQAYEVHFSNTEFCGESIGQIGDESGVTIPDEMFLSGAPIYAWTYLHTGLDDGETVYKTVISINKRAQPSNLEPTPVQQDAITQAIAALNVAVEQTAADVIAADASAQAAAGSATEASGYADEAKGYAERAESAESEAEGYATRAETAESHAQGYAQTASDKASEASGYASDAQGYADSASSSASDAQGYANDAKGYSESASASASDASGYASSAYESYQSADTAKQDAITAKNGAVQAKDDAISAKNDAVSAKNDAVQAKDDAVSAKNSAEGFASDASDSASDAQGYASDAQTSAEQAQESAEYVETALIDKADVITSTASGEIVTIADGANNLPVKNLSVSLLPVQDLHGQDAPYPPGGGTNILDYTQYVFGHTYISLSHLASYSGQAVKFTITNGSSKTIIPKIASSSGGTAVWSGGTCASNASVTYSLTLSDAMVAVNLYLIDTSTYGTLSAEDFALCKLMMNTGSTALPFAPYSNICPISGWTGVEVYQRGRNLFDKDHPNVYNGYFDGTPNKIVASSGNRIVYIPCKPNTTYTFQKIAVNSGTADRFYVGWTDTVPTANVLVNDSKGRGTNFVAGDLYSFTVTTGSDAKYLVCWLSRDTEYTASLETFQIEVGSTATAYEPYNGNTYPISWQTEAGTVYGGSLDVTTGVLTVDRAYALLNDSTKWQSTTGTVDFIYKVNFADRKKYSDSYTGLICSYMRVNYAGGGNETARWSGATSETFGIKSDLITLAQVQADATANKIAISYVLDTPLTFQLSPIQIATYLGVNNFWSNGNGQIDLEYRADTKLYIEQLTKPTEDDMVANQNITADSFFMIGNRLFLSSVGIGQGQAIVPGTNCTEISLADALNSLNS